MDLRILMSWHNSCQLFFKMASSLSFEEAAKIACHESTRTTGLYNRKNETLRREEVERIRISRGLTIIVKTLQCGTLLLWNGNVMDNTGLR